MQLREALTGDVVRELTGHATSVTHAAFNADATRLISGAEGGTVRLWDTATGQVVHEFTFPGQEDEIVEIESVDLSLDGSKALAVVENSRKLNVIDDDEISLHVWQVEDGRELWKSNDASRSGVSSFSPDGRWILTIPADSSEAKILSSSDGKAVLMLGVYTEQTDTTMTLTHKTEVAAFSPDGNTVWGLASGLVSWDVSLLKKSQ
jgi:WD40 repeat protein